MPRITATIKRRRIGAPAWILGIVGLMLLSAGLLGLPPYTEVITDQGHYVFAWWLGSLTDFRPTAARQGDHVIAWWLGKGEFGRMRTDILPADAMARPPEELRFEYQGKQWSLPHNVVLREFSLLGFEILEQQSLSSDRERVRQSLWVHIPLWIPGALLLIYPLVRVATIARSRRTRKARPAEDA